MKVLVTGATSGLGRNAAEWLIHQQHAVLATGRNTTVGSELQKQGMSFMTADLGDPAYNVVQLTQNVDWVWHCAALSAPWGAWADFEKSNVFATKRLAQAAGQAGVKRFVHISTPSLYFNFQHQQNIPESFINPKLVNHYAQSKALAEQAIHQAQQQYPDTQYTILRPRGIFGAHDRVILPRLIAQIQHNHGVLKLPRGGEAFLDLTFAPNVVHAMHLASTNENLPPAAIYNITNQEPQRLRDLIDQLFRQELGVDLHIKALPYSLLYAVAKGMEAIAAFTQKEPMLTRYSVGALNFDMTLSSNKAQTELGYTPLYHMQAAVCMTADWLRSQHQLMLALGVHPQNGSSSHG